jgi:hypothetical protein
MYRKGSRGNDSDDSKRKCIHIHEDKRIHANHDKRERSPGEAKAKIHLERSARTDVMYVCTIAKATCQYRASPRTQTEDVLRDTPRGWTFVMPYFLERLVFRR